MISKHQNKNKRISKRRYPQIKCKKDGCNIMFAPSDSRQIFCCIQHRVDHNNDNRKQKSKPFNDHVKKLKHNESVLKKAHQRLKETGNDIAAIDLLRYERFHESSFTNVSKNQETGQMVYWVNDYGIEGLKDPDAKLLIHRKNNQ